MVRSTVPELWLVTSSASALCLRNRRFLPRLLPGSRLHRFMTRGESTWVWFCLPDFRTCRCLFSFSQGTACPKGKDIPEDHSARKAGRAPSPTCKAGLRDLARGGSGGQSRSRLRHCTCVYSSHSNLKRSKSHFTMAFGAGACELKACIVCKDYFAASASFKETRIFTHFPIDPC